MILNILYILLQPITDANRDSVIQVISETSSETNELVRATIFAFITVVALLAIYRIVQKIRGIDE
jgi:hypothetical protein